MSAGFRRNGKKNNNINNLSTPKPADKPADNPPIPADIADSSLPLEIFETIPQNSAAPRSAAPRAAPFEAEGPEAAHLVSDSSRAPQHVSLCLTTSRRHRPTSPHEFRPARSLSHTVSIRLSGDALSSVCFGQSQVDPTLVTHRTRSKAMLAQGIIPNGLRICFDRRLRPMIRAVMRAGSKKATSPPSCPSLVEHTICSTVCSDRNFSSTTSRMCLLTTLSRQR
jgi:hypothetical protein